MLLLNNNVGTFAIARVLSLSVTTGCHITGIKVVASGVGSL